MGFENLPEWNPDELECLLNRLEVNENATHEPIPQSVSSMKFNLLSIADVSGIEILDDVTPVKVISQPIPLEAAMVGSTKLSSKRKQNLNVTRDGIAEFIDVDDTNARRQLVFDSSSNSQQSIPSSNEQMPTEYAKRNDPENILTLSGTSTMKDSKTVSLRTTRKGLRQSQFLSKNYVNGVGRTPFSTGIAYLKSKHGSERFICHCKRTYSSLKTYEEHRKTH